MWTKLVMKLGAKIAANPAVLVEMAPVLVPVVAVVVVHEVIERTKK